MSSTKHFALAARTTLSGHRHGRQSVERLQGVPSLFSRKIRDAGRPKKSETNREAGNPACLSRRLEHSTTRVSLFIMQRN
jgi:hypothetical protein